MQSSKNSLVGKIVADRYEVVSLIGHGAMGAVYKAKHTAIGRILAVKTLTARHDEDERLIKRFQQEAQAMSVLTHPNLIQISDYGQTEDGVPYFVMEYLEGISLSDYIKRNGPMPVQKALPVFAQIADALAHAHNKNLIHRDLKPSNIMLIGDERDFAKVVDLGIAKAVADEDQHLTQTGEVFGSPLYMSPEQCQGLQLDGRSDIYSLGCLMYETLTGNPPLRGANFVQTAYKHMNEMPPALQEVRPDIPKDIADVIMACLQKAPGDRVQNMTLLRDALRELNTTHCPENQASTVGTILSQRDTLTKTLQAVPIRQINWLLVSAVCSIPLLLAVVTGVFVYNATSRKPPQTPPSGTVQSAAVTSVMPETDSTVSVQSPLWKADNPGAPQEIDVVAVYAAQPQIGDGPPQPQEVTVDVRPQKEPITLVLFSYMPVHWNVKPFAGAVIKKVIASGFHPQEVNGAGCSVTALCAKNNDKDAFHTGVMKDSGGDTDVEENREKIYSEIQQGVEKVLGEEAEIRHFRGQYYGTHFVLDSDQNN